MKKLLSYVLSILIITSVVSPYRILLVFNLPARSHYFLGSALARGLLEAGHEVTMVAPYESKDLQKHKNYSEIILTGYEDAQKQYKLNMFDYESVSPFMQIPFLCWVGIEGASITLNHPNFKKLLRSKEHYDAFIMDQFNNDALKILSYHFKAPLILFSTINANRWINPLVGNPEPPSYIPDTFMYFSPPLTFQERVTNFIFGLIADAVRHFYFFPTQNKLMKTAYPNAPELDTLLYNASLVLVNAHQSTNQPIPHVPNMIDIGGFHVAPPKALPKDLEDFMNSAENGVIYFSMGSIVIPSQMPDETLRVLLNTLGSLKEKILWKWDGDNLPNKPDNVKISKWFPQNDILAHPNCKLFITHGGLLSTTETVYHGVPVLAFPVFGDQKLNAARAQAFGYGISLPFSQITEDSFGYALRELLETPKYRDNAKMRAQLMHDRIVKPMDTATYWVEYVIRHKGAPHLRVAALDLPLYQYFLIDVIGALLFGTVIVTLVIYLVLKKLCCRKTIKTKVDKSKKTKKS